jgi:methylmalonyl-CoA mutase C-terminal domain/subunit
MSKLAGKRIIVAKPGLDGHDVGAKVIALALRDAGAEVIYTGLRKTPEYIAKLAVEEDVDAVGLSLLSGSHTELIADTMKALEDLDGADIPVFVGGTIPTGDHVGLRRLGVKGIFTSNMEIEDILEAMDGVFSDMTDA